MSIIIRDLNGKSININTRRIDSIQSLKEKIYSRTGISINDQVLTFAGKHLEDYKKLYEYNILRNSILNLSLRLKGGIPPLSTLIFNSGSINTSPKVALINSPFSFTATNMLTATCTSGSVSITPTPPIGLSTSVVAQKLVLSGTVTSGAGTYTVTLTCDSGNGNGDGVSSFSFTLYIVSPSAYVFSANVYGNVTGTVGSPLFYTPELISGASVSSSNLSISSYTSSSITNLTNGFSSGNAVISFTPSAGDNGVYSYTIICISGTGGSNINGLNSVSGNIIIDTTIPCIVSGQRILTPSGYKLIDNIYNGDMITTSQNKDVVALNYTKKFEFTTNETAPYIIPKDSINPSYPPKDIFLSAEHRIQTNYNWVTPKELSKYNPNVRQINVGKPVIYYNIETPNYATDHLVLEGTTIGSYRFPGNYNLVNIHDNIL
jgi:hypothetical protein